VDFKIFQYLKAYRGDILLDLMEEPIIKDEIERIKQSREWRNRWNCWTQNINQVITFFTDKIGSITDSFKIKNDFRIIIPLFYKKTLARIQFDKKNFVSNFGYTFEENIMMIQKGDSVLEDNISRLVFNILCETKQLNEISVSNNWKILPKLSNQTELIKLDNLLKTKFEKYNLVINNVNSDVALPINNENVLSEEDFINTLSDVEILLFGEQHFISEQEQFLIKIYEKLLRIGFKTICLEIPEKNQKKLDLFLEGKIEDLDKNICMMRDFIFKIRDLKKLSPEIKIYCVDVNTSTLRTKEDFLKRKLNFQIILIQLSIFPIVKF
jgi:hypothetical protein